MNNISLYDLGFNKSLAEEFRPFEKDYSLGRVCAEYKGMYKILTECGEILGTISGKMNYGALQRSDYPAVGDWVVMDKTTCSVDRTIIHKILSRKSKFSRKVAGNVIEEQIIAVNIDILFICMSLNNDFNLRRLERYTTMAFESGALPVILLTKADLCEDVAEKVRAVESTCIGIDVNIISALENIGMDLLRNYIPRGSTAAFLGSSGVGKSTLINKLLGSEIVVTKEVRADDDKGRHTTTHRELFLLPEGGIVMDTPGMREFQILDAEDGINASFEDIEDLALSCRFSDCSHTLEPGCAVRAAIEEGVLPQSRFDNYVKLKKEAEYIARKNSKAAETAYIKEIKSRHKNARKHFKKAR